MAPADGWVTLDTAGSSFDAIITLYSGDPLSNLVRIAAGTPERTGSEAALTFRSQAGVSYHISVDGLYGAAGNITLHLAQSSSSTAPNDDFR